MSRIFRARDTQGCNAGSIVVSEGGRSVGDSREADPAPMADVAKKHWISDYLQPRGLVLDASGPAAVATVIGREK
jgi:hypothetical protein